jgi:cytochrome c
MKQITKTPFAVAFGFALAATLAAGPAQANEEAMNKAGCMACHAKDKKVVGPSFKDIAAKYKGQDVTAKLMEKVRKGGAGSFGPIPMSPNPPEKINDADLKSAVEMILKS